MSDLSLAIAGRRTQRDDDYWVNAIIRSMPQTQRELLERHAQGPQPVTPGGWEVRHALIRRQLLRGDRQRRPRFTIATAMGRKVAARMIADHAETMTVWP